MAQPSPSKSLLFPHSPITDSTLYSVDDRAVQLSRQEEGLKPKTKDRTCHGNKVSSLYANDFRLSL
jgi:hypothetical protein